MRFVFLAENYHRVYDRYWAAFPDARTVAFATAQERLFAEFLYQSDSQAAALRALGHEAYTLVPECIPMQRRWAREQGVWMPPYRRRNPAFVNRAWRVVTGLDRRDHWHARLLSAQLRALRPDVVQVYSGVHMTAPMVRALRPLAPRWVCHWSSTIRPAYPYGLYDLVVTTASNFESAFKRLGCASCVVQHAFDERVLERVDPDGPRDGVVFVGTLSPKHRQRAALLEAVARRVPMEVYGEGFDALPDGSALRRAWRGRALFGLEMYRAFARARMVLHVPGDDARADAGAKRLFEITGVGSLMLAEAQAGLGAHFEIGHECDTFCDADEAIRKIDHYLADESARAAIAAAGHRRTLRDHTYRVRMHEWLDAVASCVRSPAP